MYSNKTHFNIMPRTIGGLIEDIFQNGWNNLSNDSDEDTKVPVNIQETEKAYELHLIAPGLKKEDFKINIDRNILNISFEHKEEKKEEEQGKWLRTEYKMRSFKRSFTLNDKVNASGISAKYNDGILNITLPKKEPVEHSAQEIKID